MTSLADTFLADLDDLSDEEYDEESQNSEEERVDDGLEQENETDELDKLKLDSLESVAKLSQQPRYNDIMTRVRNALEESRSKALEEGDASAATLPPPLAGGAVEDDPTYKLLVGCNRLAVDIDTELSLVHNFIRDKYRPQFPELESLVHNPVDYARVILRLGSDLESAQSVLDDLLPPAQIMVVAITATTTVGKPLATDQFEKVSAACNLILTLDADKRLVLDFVESRMTQVAPNLSALVTSDVAARLMCAAGGLMALSRIPACNLTALGSKRKFLAGFSAAATTAGSGALGSLTSGSAAGAQGFLSACPLLSQAPPMLRPKLLRVLAAKAALAARVDASGQDLSGSSGSRLRQECTSKLEKWQEPPPAKTIKPLPVPDAEVKKRRGGRRLRKYKERYGLTEVHKAANRVKFNEVEEEFMDGEETIGFGALGRASSGRLRQVAGQQKQKLSVKAQKKLKVSGGLGGGGGGARTGATSLGGGSTGAGGGGGFTTNLTFTAVQGLQLGNPNPRFGSTDVSDFRDGTQSYFSHLGGFKSARK